MNHANRSILVLILFISSQTLCAEADVQPDPVALASAESFLQLLDEAEWQAAYDSGEFSFDYSLFEDAIVKHRKDRGNPIERSFVKVKPRLGGIQGADSWRKAELVFETAFPDGAWTESVTLVSHNEGPWLVEGYTIGRTQP